MNVRWSSLFIIGPWIDILHWCAFVNHIEPRTLEGLPVMEILFIIFSLINIGQSQSSLNIEFTKWHKRITNFENSKILFVAFWCGWMSLILWVKIFKTSIMESNVQVSCANGSWRHATVQIDCPLWTTLKYQLHSWFWKQPFIFFKPTNVWKYYSDLWE